MCLPYSTTPTQPNQASVVFYFFIGLLPSAVAFAEFFTLFFGFVLLNSFLGHIFANVGNLPVATLLAVSATSMMALFSGVSDAALPRLSPSPRVLTDTHTSHLPTLAHTVTTQFMISLDQVPVYFEWITYISPAKYAMTGFVNNQLSCDCTVDSATAFLDPPSCDGGFNCSDVCDADLPGCNILEVETPLGIFRTTVFQYLQDSYGYDDEGFAKNCLALLGFCVVFRLIDVVLLNVVNTQKR